MIRYPSAINHSQTLKYESIVIFVIFLFLKNMPCIIIGTRRIWVQKLIKKLIKWNVIWPYENKLDSFNFADIDILVGNTFVTCFLTKLTPSALCTITLWSKKIINHMRINIGSKFYPVIVGCKILSMLWNVQMSIQVWLEINYVELTM